MTILETSPNKFNKFLIVCYFENIKCFQPREVIAKLIMHVPHTHLCVVQYYHVGKPVSLPISFCKLKLSFRDYNTYRCVNWTEGCRQAEPVLLNFCNLQT